MWRKSLEDWLSTTSLSGFNQLYIEQLYEQYTLDNDSIDPQWAELFRDLESGSLINHSRYKDLLSHKDTVKVWGLINAYRNHGHLIANIDPLNRWKRNPSIPFNLIDYNLHPDDEINLHEPVCSLKNTDVAGLFGKLKETYTGTIGYEFGHITDQITTDWLIKFIEKETVEPSYSEQLKILSRLVRAEELEKSIANKFPGAKRFSLEGTESYVNLIDKLLECAADNNYRDVFLSMAHRGRLNTLVNHCDLNTSELYQMFAGQSPLNQNLFSSDVKYHMGRSVTLSKGFFPYDVHNIVTPKTDKQEYLKLHLCYNPSHLEYVGSVLLGEARAKQQEYNFALNIDQRSLRNHYTASPGVSMVLPIMVHGDSAVSGQGIVQEVLNLANTRAYSVGGTIHIIINNQIGFTTNKTADMRSAIYASDIGKAIDAPILHVNADDPIAVVKAARLAFSFRERFKKDIFIDLIGYRRLGHNEGDDPSVTQPVLYSKIKVKDLISTVYAKNLEELEIISANHLAELRTKIYNELISGDYQLEFGCFNKCVAGEIQEEFTLPEMTANGRPYAQNSFTPASISQLQEAGNQAFSYPESLKVSNTLANMYAKRLENIANPQAKLNWGDAELLAYTRLLDNGINIRLTGEDAGRGTFFHRGAVLHDAQNDGHEYIPLETYAADKNSNFEIFDSTLTETGVLGFEYGYSLLNPNNLTVWEAQFGDFANCAQVIIDQFITSGETKWNQVSNLALYLPHGYEGNGPEHSSARIERYLQLAANNNMRIVQPTTAAQMYALILEHGLQAAHKPLICFTPKSLLRSPNAQTSLEELSNISHYSKLLADQSYVVQHAQSIKKLVLTTGKIRFDVAAVLTENNNFNNSVFAASLEEYYPWPAQELENIVTQLPNLEVIEIVQDEPENQGVWHYALPRLLQLTSKLQAQRKSPIHININSRKASATTAVGYGAKHKEELQEILNRIQNLTEYFI